MFVWIVVVGTKKCSVSLRLKYETFSSILWRIFQENTSPNDFGPILAEDNAAVKLEECTFKNNTPDLLDAFSGGKFFSDEKRTVWNNPTATFITTGTIAQSEISRSTFLDASDPFLAEQEVCPNN